MKMIKNFRHKGLERFFDSGSKKGIVVGHAQKLADMLDRLHAAQEIRDMNYPGSHLHPLKGNLKEYWSVRVSGNWRVIFRFKEGNALDVDYIDYH